MRKIAWIIVGLALLWPLSLAAQSEGYDSSRFVRVTYVKGDVTVDRAGDLGSEEATVNLALVEGDKLSVGDGRAEIDFGRKNFLRLDRGTVVELSDLPQAGDDRTRLHVLSGRVYLRLNSLDEEKSFELHTPDASYYMLEPGLYRFDVRANAETQLDVVEGSVEAAGEGGSQLIASREQLLASNGRLGSQGSLSYSRDDFDNFNDNRDSLHSQYVSRSYLPSELDDYEEELADNGSWAYERPYGYVWVPTISYNDWRPYYYGYWDWYDSCGWTWVPEESWGWPVYHYGRWQWRLGLGWYWIPHRAWGPAWVHWYHGADYFGWCPLSWYNYPAVLVDNYFYDRFHGERFPGHNRAMTVVRRDQLQDRHISRVALSHLQASRLGQISLDARQPDVRPIVNRAGLRGSSLTRNGVQPQLRSFERTPGLSRSLSPSRVTGSPSPGRERPAGFAGQSSSGRTVSRGGLAVNRGEAANPRSTVGSRSSDRSASGRTEQAPRKSRTEGGVSPRSQSSNSASGVRSYSPSPGVTSPERRTVPQRRETPRRYSPSASISRFGTNRGFGALGGTGSQSRTPGTELGREWSAGLSRRSPGTGYRPGPWPPSPYTVDRLESSNRSGSFYSPRSSSGSRGLSRPSFAPRSFSGPGGSRGSSSGSYAAPRSSWRSGSGRSVSSGSRSSSRSSSGFGSARGSSGSRSSSSRSSSSRSSSSSRGSGGRVSRRG
jgi:hypothetical protein